MKWQKKTERPPTMSVIDYRVDCVWQHTHTHLTQTHTHVPHTHPEVAESRTGMTNQSSPPAGVDRLTRGLNSLASRLEIHLTAALSQSTCSTHTRAHALIIKALLSTQLKLLILYFVQGTPFCLTPTSAIDDRTDWLMRWLINLQ